MCTYTHVLIHKPTSTCVHMQARMQCDAHEHTSRCMHTLKAHLCTIQVHTLALMYTCIHACMCTHSYRHEYAHVCSEHACACTHGCIHVHTTHTCTHAHACTHIHTALALFSLLQWQNRGEPRSLDSRPSTLSSTVAAQRSGKLLPRESKERFLQDRRGHFTDYAVPSLRGVSSIQTI